MASKATKRGLISLGGLVLVAVLFVAVNVIGNASLRLGAPRPDLDKLFTLSEGTRSVLAKIEEPITLRFYFSDRLGEEIPHYGVYATRVRELLREYANASGGKLRVEFIDPQPFTDDEDRAVAFGLQGVPVNQGGELVYFGLAGTNTADKEETIAFFQPERERFLEYDLTKLVYNLAITKKPAVGLLSSLPLQGEFRGPRQPPEPWAIFLQLTQFFEVKHDRPRRGRDPGGHRRAHARPSQGSVRQDAVRDRPVRAARRPRPRLRRSACRGRADPAGMAAQTGLTGSNLPKLFAAWGIEMLDGKFAGDRAARTPRQRGHGDARARRRLSRRGWPCASRTSTAPTS